MINTSFIKRFLLALTVVFLYSCDKDFNAIGDGLIGDDHFGLEPEQYDVVAFNQEVTPVQSNFIPTNALGIYDNPVFGTTTANFVTQVVLSSYAPTIGESPVIENAVLTIPYFVKTKTTDADGASTYVLDSIYGDKNGKLDLKVYESGIQMRNSYFNGGSQLTQFYYTDQNSEFETKKVGNFLNDSIASPVENTAFFFDPKEIVTKTVDATDPKKETTTRTAPQMVLHLNKEFFQQKILNAPASKLASDDVFQEYFRGLYFNVAKSGSSASNMALLNFAEGKITINYKAKTASTTDDANLTERKQIVLNLTTGSTANPASTANFLQNVWKSDYAAAITTNVNKTEGDERLYLKGGQGSAAVIRLTGFAAQLETIRKTNWKVNEANLVFYIDAEKMTGTDEPLRLYLYDLDNNTVLADYSTELGAAYGGVISKGTDKRGISYKFRITNHIRNLIKDATATNVNLGLVVSQSNGTAAVASNVLKNKAQIQDDPVKYFSQVPRGSIMSTLGTILYGGKVSANTPNDKRLRLEVYYTKPN
ncbi:hypothetical protein HNP37_001061 [Flavobacterium nitrogenifigens]|uniref:DUF4270 domain-containing protein n=2 Tax=Flavobacterium TaxID=237 RepID=A0A7W7IUW8_9FLAO|nr:MULTISPECIES: DUF4270 domain-containing protein [Flavobacterium]MBB4801022.1 hypothetical protein [Flavobacterium nitrogenifigens]MBB6385230.1 hypothetical protein [Flavobacterium notoginsengisoli]